MITKTMVCINCGKEWTDIKGQPCEGADSGKHHLIRLIDNHKEKNKDTLVCQICGQEWGENPSCALAEDKRHRFAKIQVQY